MLTEFEVAVFNDILDWFFGLDHQSRVAMGFHEKPSPAPVELYKAYWDEYLT